jgi:hypothetical protein
MHRPPSTSDSPAPEGPHCCRGRGGERTLIRVGPRFESTTTSVDCRLCPSRSRGPTSSAGRWLTTSPGTRDPPTHSPNLSFGPSCAVAPSAVRPIRCATAARRALRQMDAGGPLLQAAHRVPAHLDRRRLLPHLRHRRCPAVFPSRACRRPNVPPVGQPVVSVIGEPGARMQAHRWLSFVSWSTTWRSRSRMAVPSSSLRSRISSTMRSRRDVPHRAMDSAHAASEAAAAVMRTSRADLARTRASCHPIVYVVAVFGLGVGRHAWPPPGVSSSGLCLAYP